MSITAFKRAGLAGYIGSGLFTLWQGYDTATTALGSLPFHPIHFLLGTGIHAGLTTLGYFVGVRGSRWFYKEAKRREIPSAKARKALAR